MTRPPINGFSIRITGTPTEPGPAPAHTGAGRAEPVRVEGGGPCWSGWILAGQTGIEPVSSAYGVTVLLAGELYHTEELRAAIGPPADGVTSGAELLLACWLRYGASGLRLLDGRFAAVITADGAVVVATDHAGSVPLYLRRGPYGIEVATEAKALAGPASPAEPASGTDPLPGPVGVHRVRAGTAITMVPGTGMAHAITTWRPPVHRVVMPETEAVAKVAAVLDASVRSRLDGDPVTVVLSGGVDSSTVAALAVRSGVDVATISLGTDAGDEFAAARLVSGHLGTRHSEFRTGGEELVRQLPWVVAAAEIVDAEVLEYLLPLVVLYRLLPEEGLRILTGYGADIPLGGMHRTTERLDSLDEVIASDMDTFDGLNELSPVLSGVAGHWTTHPFWDRAVLEVLTSIEPGLKRRHGRDKWVLREAVRELLPDATVNRPKLGIHEGSGTTSTWTTLLLDAGVGPAGVPAAKRAMAQAMYRRVVARAEPPDDVSFDEVLNDVVTGRALEVIP